MNTHRMRAIGLFVLIFLSTWSATASENPFYRPKSGENNLWFILNDSETVFVFVHGIFSDSRDAWYFEGNNNNRPQYWPNLLKNDPTFNSPSIFLAGFYTALDSGKYNMRDAANELHQALISQQGGGSVLDKPNIIFITHSTGGIVTRHMLVNHKDIFRNKRVGLLLYASPSNGSKDASRLALVAKVAENKMGQQLQWDNDFLDELDKAFKNLVHDQVIPGLVGQEYIENHFIIKHLMFMKKEVLVEDESGGRYFREPIRLPNTDHFSVVKPYGERHPAHRNLQNFYRNIFLKKQHPACATPLHFQLHFRVADDPSLIIEPSFGTSRPPQPNLSFKQDEPKSSYFLPINIARQSTPDPHYQQPVTLPCIGKVFKGQFTRVITDSVLDKNNVYQPTQICFIRGRTAAPVDKAVLACVERQQCSPDQRRDLGMALPCAHGALRAHKPWFARRDFLVSSAYAQGRENGSKSQRWIIPSLKTLNEIPAEVRPGYTEFTITSSSLHGLDSATSISYTLSVNNTLVLIDGWPAHEIRYPLNSSKGLNIGFAMQNLGFSGAFDGRERINVDMTFWADEKVINKVRFGRWYTALRDGPAVSVKVGNHGIAIWKAIYRSPLRPDKFEIFLMSDKSIEPLKKFKISFDELAVRFGEFPVVAVLRPKLGKNPHHGLVVGLQQPTGQIRFTFDMELANSLCRWVRTNKKNSKLAPYLRDDIYRYENQPRRDEDNKFKFCKDIY